MQLSKVILAALAACVADAITIREVSNGIQLVNNNGGCLCNAANNGVKWGNGCGSNDVITFKKPATYSKPVQFVTPDTKSCLTVKVQNNQPVIKMLPTTGGLETKWDAQYGSNKNQCRSMATENSGAGCLASGAGNSGALVTCAKPYPIKQVIVQAPPVTKTIVVQSTQTQTQTQVVQATQTVKATQTTTVTEWQQEFQTVIKKYRPPNVVAVSVGYVTAQKPDYTYTYNQGTSVKDMVSQCNSQCKSNGCGQFDVLTEKSSCQMITGPVNPNTAPLKKSTGSCAFFTNQQ